MRKKLCHERIANALVENAINDGFLISVTGKRMCCRPITDFAEITKAMFSTDMDTLTLNVEERRVGIIKLVYGDGSNGLGVISDHTDVPHINRLVEHTLKEIEPSYTANLQGPGEPSIGGPARRPHADLSTTSRPADDRVRRGYTMSIDRDRIAFLSSSLTQ